MVHLTTEIGQGDERRVYAHPEFEERVVKVPKSTASSDRNAIEARYCSLMTARQRACLPRFYGWEHTQFGPALVYEAVRDADGALSQPLKDVVLSGALGKERADALVGDLADRLFAVGLVACDTNPSNLLYRRSGGGGELVIVDGFGPFFWKWKDPLRTRLPILARRKLVRSRERLLLGWQQWCETNAIAA